MAVAEWVKALIVDQLGVDAAAVTPGARFTDDLAATSLDGVELVMACEVEFGIAIPDDEAEHLGTVGEAIAYIEQRVGPAS